VSAVVKKIARRTDAETAEKLARAQGVRVFTRTDGTLLALFDSDFWLDRVQNQHPDWTLDTIVTDGGSR
jgi:peptide chain release factor 3